jgi:hypothetical protein
MPRPQRIAFPGAYYHLSHGASHEGPAIFRCREDMAQFFALLECAVQRFDVAIYAYCVLPKRYHVLLQTHQPNVHQVMRYINHGYAGWLKRPNTQHQIGHQGGCFAGRYQSSVIDAQRYLAAVSVVIHREAMAVTGKDLYPQYRWSSMRAYLGKGMPQAWLHTDPVLQQMRVQHPQSGYSAYAQCDLPAPVQHFYQLKRRPQVLGDAIFCQQLKAMPLHTASQAPQPGARMVSDVGMADIVRCTADYFHVSEAVVLAANRGRLNVARNVAIYLARLLTQATTVQVASYFGLNTHSAVSNVGLAMRERMPGDVQLADACAHIEAQLSTSMASLADGVGFDVF